MTVELDEVKLHEMEEDIANYIKLIKKYDEAIIVKDKLIKGYEHELSVSKDIIVSLLYELEKGCKRNKTKAKQISEIINDIENLQDEE